MNLAEKRLHQLLEKIENETERGNIERDLDVLCQRIESGEYRNTDFLDRQQFDTPRRVYEFFNYFIGYYRQSLKWAAMLKKIPLNKVDLIFDFCPGSAPKIEWALKKCDYTQKLYIFERDETAGQQLKLLLAIFQGRYHYELIKADIYHSFAEQADLITANHVIDDLVLDHYCKQNKVALCSIYGSERIFREVTRRIPSTLDRPLFCEHLFQAMDAKLKKHGYLMMNHYASVTAKALKLVEWPAWLMELFKEIYRVFLDKGYKTSFAKVSLSSGFFILQK